MKQHRSTRLFSVLILLLLVVGAMPLATAQEPGALDKIEGLLLDQFNTEQSANFFVMMTEKPDLNAAPEIADWDARGQYVYDVLREVAGRTQAPAIEYAKAHGLNYRSFLTINAVYIKGGSLEAALGLASLSGVDNLRLERYIELEPIETEVSPDAYGWNLDTLDPGSSQYGMQAAQVWSQFGVYGDGIVVANIDTGVYYEHEALVEQYRGNLGGGSFDHDFNWYLPTSGCPDPLVPCDNNSHGSGTIGIMIGEKPDMTEQIGVAPGAKWIACKGCESSSCSEAALTGCADWMVAPCPAGVDPGDPSCDSDMRPHVINNSWGGGSCDPWYDAYVAAWVAAGQFPAFSAGNASGCGTLGSPGDTPQAFGTAAHNTPGTNLYAGGPSCYFTDPSCDPYAHEVDPHLNAPTYGRTASNSQGAYFDLGGTSGASPHTGGAVALLWAANPAYVGDIPGTFWALEQGTNHTVPAGVCGKPTCAGANDWPNFEYGWGYLDALGMLNLAGVGGTGYLHGTVTEGTLQAPGDPLPNITILAERDGGGSRNATTDPTGYYTMSMSVGTYTVTASGEAYTAQTVTGIDIQTDSVVLQDFALTPKGLVYGFVTDIDTGAPLDGAQVTADDGTFATAGATGYYTMYLDAGTYVMTATMVDYAPDVEVVVVPVGGSLQQDFELQAAIAVAPDPIEIWVEMFQLDTLNSVITNNLPTAYDFGFVEVEEVAMGLDHAGGPDPFGYTFKDNLEPDGPLYDFADISATGTGVSLGDDDYDGPFPLGFTFNFYGNDYTQFYIQSNGVLNFIDEYVTLGNQCPLPSGSTPNNLIGMMWDDLNPSSGGSIYYENFAVCPYPGGACTIVQFVDVPHYSSSPSSGVWQAILFDNGNILIQFEDVGGEAGSGSTTGIENSDGTIGLAYYCDTGSLFNESAVCFNYPGAPPCGGGDIPWFATSIVSGTVPAGGSLGWTNTFTATPAAGVTEPGDYFGRLLVIPGNPGDPMKDVPIIMHVTPPSNLGLLDGTITSDRPGGPLEGAVVWIDDGTTVYSATTDVAGYYYHWLLADTYDITATMAGYLPESDTVVITGQQTTTRDFQLVLDAPEIDVDPLSIAVTLLFGDSTARTLTISNTGVANLYYDLTEQDRGMNPLISIPPFKGTLPEDDRPISSGRDPNAPQLSGEAANMAFPLAGEPAFAVDLSGENLVYIPDTTVPGGWVVIGSVAGTQYFAGDFVGGDFSQMYIIDYGANTLYSLDTTTATPTAIGACTPISGQSWTGATGSADGTFYASSAACGTASQLYTVDIATGAATPVGDITGATCIIDIAINADGEMYGVEIVTDQLYQIDPATGAATVVGSLGVTANYAQGMDFEEDTGVLYWAAYTSQGELRIIDTATGASTLVGPFPGGTETDCLAFETGGGGDVPWLSEDPISGTVVPAAGEMVDVTFDAGAVPEPGIYMANLNVNSNDPYEDRVVVAVTMTVLPSPDIGKLDGTITGTGYCDADSYPLEADVLIESSTGMSWTTMSDPSGYYYRWLDAGLYTVTASAPDHLDNWGTIQVFTDTTNTLDLDLRYIESCMDVDPLSFAITLPIGIQFTDTLNIDNYGAGDLAWEIQETTSTLVLLDEDVIVNVPAIEARPDVASRSGSVGRPARQFKVHVGRISQQPINVLLVTPDVVGGGDISLLLGTLAAFPDLNVTLWDGNAGTPTVADMEAHDVVFVGNDILWSSSAIDKTTLSNNMADYIDAGGKVLAGSFIWSFDDWGFGGGRFITDDYSPYEIASLDIWDPTTLGNYDTGHPIMAGITNVTDNFNHQDPALSPNGTWIASWADDEHFVAESPNCVGLNQVYFHSADFGGQTGELLHNALLHLAVGATEWIDIPWVSEVPTTGVTLGDSTFPVDIIFDTTGLSLGVCYTGSLGLFHDDPGWDDPVMIPLELCVSGECDPVEILDVYTDVAGCVVTFTADLTGTLPFSYDWDFGAFGPSTDPAPVVDFGASGTYPFTLTVNNPCDEDTYTGTVTVECIPCYEPSDLAFDWTPLQPGENVDVTFSGYATGTAPLSFTWNFGDGNVGAGITATHAYTPAGDYVVTLTVTNECGSATLTNTITVLTETVCDPVSIITYTAAVSDCTVDFSGELAGAAPFVHLWTFGDGVTSTEVTPTHVYDTPGGTFTVTLEVWNCVGEGDYYDMVEFSVTVACEEPCDPVSIITYTAAVSDCTIDFSGELAGTAPFVHLWTFGDGVTSTEVAPTHVYDTPGGTFTVTLEVSNCEGADSDDITFAVTVDCAPDLFYVYLPLVFKNH